jgi:hypothetical protein
VVGWCSDSAWATWCRETVRTTLVACLTEERINSDLLAGTSGMHMETAVARELLWETLALTSSQDREQHPAMV